MHILKMVHRDIKELNIGWSKEKERWVFLDFGFAKFLKEGVGEKSLATYIGTYQYVLK